MPCLEEDNQVLGLHNTVSWLKMIKRSLVVSNIGNGLLFAAVTTVTKKSIFFHSDAFVFYRCCF